MIRLITTAVLFLAGTEPQIANHPHGQINRAYELAETLVDAANNAGVDPVLLTALAYRESRFDERAVSRVGAIGLLQALPRWWPHTWTRCVTHPAWCRYFQAFEGARVLRFYKDKCGTDTRAIRAFRTGRCLPPVETTRQVLRTRDFIESLREERS